MEEIKNNETCSHKDCCCKNKVCGAGFCANCMKYPVLRWVLGIIIIFLLLGLGIKIGEFKVMCSNGVYRYGSSFDQNVRFGMMPR